MCGFVGIINNNIFSEKDLSEKISQLNNLISHRGPDNQEIYVPNSKIAFGFSRLAIQDTSKLANQPFITPNKRYVICFNGEIFNFLEIKKKINFDNYKFQTSSDTEVISALISKYGIVNGLKFLQGMFAIAIYDFEKNQIYLTKDIYGKKPLYYFIHKNTLFFSSEMSPKFLKIARDTDTNPNNVNINFFMNFGFFQNHLDKNVENVHNSEIVKFTFQNNQIEVNKKKLSEFTNPSLFKSSKSLLDFEQTLENSVSRRLISDRPLGLFLSSGYDSNIIAYYANKLSKKKIKAYTLGFKNSSKFNEINYQNKLIKENFDFDFEQIYIEHENIKQEVNNISSIDLPIADPSFFLERYLCKQAKKSVDVILTGDGGDELFGGYNRYKFLNFNIKTFLNFNKSSKYILISIIKFCEQNNFLKNFFFKKLFDIQTYEDKFEKILATINSNTKFDSYFNLLSYDIQNNNIKEFYTTLPDLKLTSTRNKNYFQILDLMFYMQHNILFKIDRASMLNGLEIRSPFLDEDILRKFFYSDINKPNKKILKKLARKLNLDGFINNKKMGFSFDIQKYLEIEKEDIKFEVNNINESFNDDQKKIIMFYINQYNEGKKNNFWFIWKFYILNKFLNGQ